MLKEQDNTVSMLINGNRYHGWLSVEISTVLMNLAREFTLSVTRNNVDGKVNIHADPFAQRRKAPLFFDANHSSSLLYRLFFAIYSATASGSMPPVGSPACRRSRSSVEEITSGGSSIS